MKTKQIAVVPTALTVVCLLLAGKSHAQSANPSIPVGSLTAYPTTVQTGTKPTLTWNILHPSMVQDVAFVNPPGTLVATKAIYVSVQAVGTGISGCSGNPVPANTQSMTEARLSLNGSAYKQLFYGSQSDVDPSKYLYIKKLKAGDTVDFGGRFVASGAWSPFYTTRSSNLQVIALLDGQTIPTTLPLYQQSYLASYLRPYLGADSKVRIGSMSVLILMEFDRTNRTEKCFDYQDFVLLATFSTQHPNNGNGNNLDGVDSSNPGQGGGGPNGEVDPSGGVDDEIR
ncbi:MAG: hypothetical protein K9N23_15245 [Akkermansiaceae bacterium]|nr:hypothetical protein [Akkermansiaceae bacterium]